MKTSHSQIPWAQPYFGGNEKKYMNEALDSLWISGGPFVDRLEKEFQVLHNRTYAKAMTNGTAALHCAYLAIGLQKGDEVLIPGFGFLAAANMALHMGCTPVFAEVDPKTWCLSLDAIKAKITKRTKAIVTIHTYGNMCEMKSICDFAEAHDIWVIEDCAEALFSSEYGAYAGSFGDVATFSFQATKTITTGEGGMVITDDEELYHRISLFQSHGLEKRGTYNHVVPGHNFRMTNFQAALGVAQLEDKEAIIKRRDAIYSAYVNNLNKIPVELQRFPPSVNPVVWTVAIQLPTSAMNPRKQLIEYLASHGVEVRPGFSASSRLSIYSPHQLPVVEALSDRIICLPTFISLSNEEISMVCELLYQGMHVYGYC